MTEIKLSPFDAAEYINTPEEVGYYLEAALEDGDDAAFLAALGVVARSKGMADLAKTAGVTRPSLYKSLSEKGKPEFATVKNVLAGLGLTLHVAPAIPSRGAPAPQAGDESVAVRRSKSRAAGARSGPAG